MTSTHLDWIGRFIVIALLGMFIVILAGCAHQPPKGRDQGLNAAVHVSDIQAELKLNTATIETATNHFLRRSTTQSVPRDMIDDVVVTATTNNNNKQLSERLSTVAKQEDADAKFSSSETIRANKAETANNSRLYAALDGLLYLGILAVVVGVVASQISKRMGISALAVGGDAAVGGVLLITLALGIKSVGPYMWMAGLAFVVELIGASVWFMWKNRKRLQARAGLEAIVKQVPDSQLVMALPAMNVDERTTVKKAYADVMAQDATSVVTPELMPSA